LSGLHFFFTCEEVRTTGDAPERTTPTGIWLPNLESEFHTKVVNYGNEARGIHNNWVYHFDGFRMNRILKSVFESTLSQGTVVKAKTVSIYHQSSNFWGVLHDISPEDEEDEDDVSSNRSNGNIDWNLVRFARPTNSSDQTIGVSSVDVIGQYETLYATREDQEWPGLLFPDRYQPSFRRRDREDQTPPYGSLNGNLCVLIALLAFSARPFGPYVNDTFMTCINAAGWRDPPGPRSYGCMLCYTHLLIID
jgi:hypothetical protein